MLKKKFKTLFFYYEIYFTFLTCVYLFLFLNTPISHAQSINDLYEEPPKVKSILDKTLSEIYCETIERLPLVTCTSFKNGIIDPKSGKMASDNKDYILSLWDTTKASTKKVISKVTQKSQPVLKQAGTLVDSAPRYTWTSQPVLSREPNMSNTNGSTTGTTVLQQQIPTQQNFSLQNQINSFQKNGVTFYSPYTYSPSGLPEQIARYVNPSPNVLQTVLPGEVQSMYIHGLSADTLNGINVQSGSNAYNILAGSGGSGALTIGSASTTLASLLGNIVNVISNQATNLISGGTTTIQSAIANILTAPLVQINASNTQVNSIATTTITSGQANVFNAPTTQINSSTTTITGTTLLSTLLMGTTTPTAGKLATFYGDIDVTGTIDPTRILFTNKAGAGSPSFNPMTDGGGNYRIEFSEGAGLNFKSSATNNILQLNSDGNVGIGTAAPTSNLHIFSNNSETKTKYQNNAGVFSIGMGNFTSSVLSGNNALVIKNENTNTDKFFVSEFITGVKNRLLVDGTSKFNSIVEVNTDMFAKRIKADSLELTTTAGFAPKNAVAFKYWPSGITDHYETQELFSENQYALTTDHNIRASEFHATSDERIKNIKGYSDSELDLESLNKILITDYALKEDELSTTSPVIQKKVIAQQIEKITPNLVTKSKGFIPVEPYYVNFVKNGTTTDLYIGGIKYLGDRRFKYQHKDRTTGVWEKNTVKNISEGEAVITNEEVNDLRTVDYDGLTTLTISGLQEVSRKVFGQNKTSDLLKNYKISSFEAGEIDEIIASSTLPLNEKVTRLGLNQKKLNKLATELTSTSNAMEETVEYFDGVSTSTKVEQTFTSKLFSKLKSWFAEPMNKIAEVFTGRVNTKEVCVFDDEGGKTCISKKQLDALLTGGGVSPHLQTSGQSQSTSNILAPTVLGAQTSQNSTNTSDTSSQNNTQQASTTQSQSQTNSQQQSSSTPQIAESGSGSLLTGGNASSTSQ